MTKPAEHVEALITEIRTAGLADIERRLITAIDRDMTGFTTADGFPTSTMGRGGNAVLTSVESAAERRANLDGEQQYRADMIHEHSVNALGYLRDAANALGACKRRLDQIDRLLSGELPKDVGRFTGGGNCVACHRPCSGHEHDRLRGGFCDACRKAWERQDRPDRGWFIAHRRPYDEPERVPIETAGP